MVSLADEFDADSLIANPFLDLPILTAARAFLAEREFLAKPPENMSPTMVLLMRQWSETSLDRLKDALKKMGCTFTHLVEAAIALATFNLNSVPPDKAAAAHVTYGSSV